MSIETGKKIRGGWRIVLLIAIVAIIMSYNYPVFTTNNSIEYVDPKSDLVDIPLAGQTIEQHFFANEPVRSVEFVVYRDPESKPVDFTLNATLINYDTDENYGTIQKTVSLKDTATRVRFDFPDTMTVEINEFVVRLASPDAGSSVFLHATEKGYPETLVINKEKQDDHRLIFKVQYSNNLMLAYFAFALVVLTVSLFFLLFPQRVATLKPHQFFIVLALISGIALAFISPSGQEPDIGDHILRSFDVSYGNITPVFRQTYDKNVQMPTNFSEFNDQVLEPGLNKGLARQRKLLNTYFASGESGVQDYRYKSNYSAVTYWPQGLGLYLGRVFSWNAFDTIILARIFNLLVYIFLTQLAIKQLPTLKNTLMVIALIPIAVNQASTLSADAVLNGLSFLFAAQVLSLATRNKAFHIIQLLPSAICLYIVILAKPAYVILALLYFIIPARKLNLRLTVLHKYAALVIAGTIVASILFGFSAGWLKLAENNPVYETQLDYILKNLVTTFNTLVRTLDVSGYQYLSWLNMLGWINYSLGMLIIVVPLYIVLVGLAEEQPFEWSAWQRIVLWGVFILTIAGIFVGLYAFDNVNSIGASLMLGVQGRYFIPVFIYPFIALRRPFVFTRPAGLSSKLAGISGLMLTYTMLTLTRLIY
ncbi:MAG: DUF2142 domain-containing protein [Clostridia bacterium]|nr:DUF2142 domain-containing protein [Clostridia bacterium]